MGEPARKRLNRYTYAEGQTNIGHMVEFTCHPDDIEKVKVALEDIRTIHPPVNHKVNVGHGSYGRYSRFNIEQHKYAGGRGGFIEVLEVRNAPDGRCGIVFHQYDTRDGSVFYEFETVEQAEGVFEKNFKSRKSVAEIAKDATGFVREVKCGNLSPWFYALGDQHLNGDFVFPDVITEDPDFLFGKKYVVFEHCCSRGSLHSSTSYPVIKTCVGVRLLTRDDGYHNRNKGYRRVFWDDGTYWDEGINDRPRLVCEDEVWIHEAVEEFRLLLSGETDKFEINFANGDKFVGRFRGRNPRERHPAGSYYVKARCSNGEIVEGDIEFEPTEEVPTVEAELRRRAKAEDAEIKEILVVRREDRSPGARWAGVFHVR